MLTKGGPKFWKIWVWTDEYFLRTKYLSVYTQILKTLGVNRRKFLRKHIRQFTRKFFKIWVWTDKYFLRDVLNMEMVVLKTLSAT